MEAVTLFLACLVLAFYFSWRLALVNMAFMPALVLTGMLQVKFTKFTGLDKSALISKPFT